MSESSSPTPATPPKGTVGGRTGSLRGEISPLMGMLLAVLTILLVVGVWQVVTWGELSEQRWISADRLPSPGETFSRARLKSLWFNSALLRNLLASLWRLLKGFGLAALLGVPLGVVCGCFPRIAAMFSPLLVFGRNIPMAALIPLTMLVFGIDELQKVMFLFIAAVAFVISDTEQAVRDIDQRYVDTAYTLGARRWQVIFKVLFPLALPSILNSLRLLFGLAFGYIMLAEVITSGNEAKGIGGLINVFQRRGDLASIYLVLFVIPLVAYGIDRLLFKAQVELLPHRYGGRGALVPVVRGFRNMLESLRPLVLGPVTIDEALRRDEDG